jgi:tetratricopeptide (TPR) repeat protein
VGKTTVATEFVHRYGGYFAGGVFWLSFADPANVPAEIAQCGGERGLQLRPDFHDLPLEDQVAAVQRAWAEEIPRLLVFDNVDTDDAEKLVQQYRPTTGGCRVLITSRRGVWDKALGIVALPLGVLQREESIALLRQFRADLSDADADAIAEELGDLPLALHLAGSFLALYTDLSVADYLAELHSDAVINHESLRGVDTTYSPTNHDLHVGITFTASYRRLDATDATDELARALLVRAACFAPGEPIPRDLLLRTLRYRKTDSIVIQMIYRLFRKILGKKRMPLLVIEDADHVTDRDAQRGLRRLIMLGLLKEADNDLILHRLLAVFIQQTTQDNYTQTMVEKATIKHTRSLEDVAALWLPLLPHLRYVTESALPREDLQAVGLANLLANCLKDMFGDYAAARPLYERALAIREQVLGPKHRFTMVSMDNLAKLLHAQGDYAGARSLHERALAIREQVLGPQHSAVADSLGSLGVLLHDQGDYAEARSLHERALAIREQVQGPQHPATAGSLNNLAGLLRDQGDYAGARPLLERALAIWEQVLGPQHPATAQSLNNLAGLLDTMGDYAGARSLLERALAIWEQVLGPQHPATAGSLNNLAGQHYAQGDYTAARPLYERALAIREQVLGPQHPATAQSLNNLALLLKAQGDDTAARPLLERALAIREQVLGPQHPDTAGSLNNLATLHYAQGDYTAARPLLERALAICEQVLGPQHPDTALSLNNLAGLLHDQGDYAAARSLHERALAIREQVLGPQHPDTALSLNNLAGLLHDQGDYTAARPLYERALAIREQVLGPQHPDTAGSLNDLAVLLLEMNDLEKARVYNEQATTAQPQNDLSHYWQALILLSTGDRTRARGVLEYFYQISNKDALSTLITHFWHGVIAELDEQLDQRQAHLSQADQSLTELNRSAQLKMQGLLVTYKGDVSDVRESYSRALEEPLKGLPIHRLYLKLLVRLFPERAAFHDTHTWLATGAQLSVGGDTRKERIEPPVHPAEPQVQQMREALLAPAHAHPLEPLLDQPFAGAFHHPTPRRQT